MLIESPSGQCYIVALVYKTVSDERFPPPPSPRKSLKQFNYPVPTQWVETTNSSENKKTYHFDYFIMFEYEAFRLETIQRDFTKKYFEKFKRKKTCVSLLACTPCLKSQSVKNFC